jgi:predicted phosphodiesterase
MKKQMATRKDRVEVYRRINQVLELIKEIVGNLEKNKEEKTKPMKIKSKKKEVEILSLHGKKTDIQVPSSWKMEEILHS